MDMQISYSNGVINYDVFDSNLVAHKDQIEQLESVCSEDDITDAAMLLAYYRLQAIHKARRALTALEGVVPDNDLDTVNMIRNQLIDVAREFDSSLSEFQIRDAGDGDCVMDEDGAREYAEEVLLDKIRNIRSCFRYYCEELRRVCANVDIEL